MKDLCIFRVQFAGDMWRVLESSVVDESGQYEYRIMHKRRVVERFKRCNGRRAIELCMRYAAGCGIDIWWEKAV